LAVPGLTVKKRQVTLLVVFTVIVAILIGRLAYIQFVQAEELQKKAFDQQNAGRIISPIRGAIYDRNGKKLAISVQAATIGCRPSEVRSNSRNITEDEIADGLAPILGMDRDDIYRLITKDVSYVLIKRKVDRETEKKVRSWISVNKVKGITIDEDAKRYYPNGNLMCHVLGFTGDDNQGLMGGIEEVMDKYLKGTPGKILSEVDAINNAIPSTTEKRIDAQDGLNVVLTIDETIQYLVSKSLEKAIDDYKLKQGAAAIVMDPNNGDILALVSKPDYDLNSPFSFPESMKSMTIGGIDGETLDPSDWVERSVETVNILSRTVWRNKAISDTYEPGSTFKSFTAAAGIEEGVVTPDTITNDLPIKVTGWPKPINCWRVGRPHGTETFREAVHNSCNPAFVKVAQSLGLQRFYNYVKAFGFKDKTGIELLGEGKGLFQEKPKEIDMAVASFGQRFTITPLQLITGYTAIVNGGKLMKPRLIKELTDSDGNIVKRFEPEAVRTVISKKTSDTVKDILEGVVSTPNGTGNNAYVKGYRIGGKTGTSQTTDQDVHIASFCGFAPADNPSIIVLVVLFDPKGDSYMGGVVAAPVAGKIIEDILNYMQVEKKYTEEDLRTMTEEVYVPEVRGKTVEDAVKDLRAAGLKYKVEGDGGNMSEVVEQMPKPDAVVPENSVVLLYVYKPEKQQTVQMPDLSGKTVSEAIEAMNRANLNIKIIGNGIAFRQQYKPGAIVEAGQVVSVEFRNMDNKE
jgi:stage V sporulation protein D (sporulation-specific penicillin-binding protein)